MTSGQGVFIVVPAARQHLRAHAEFLGQANLTRAAKFLKAASDTMADLVDQPNMGATYEIPDSSLHSLRRFRVRNHRAYWIYYRPFVSGNGIEVLAVLHERQDAGGQLKGVLEP